MVYCIHRQHEEYLRRTLDYSEDSTQPASANSSVSEGPNSPLVLEPNIQSMEADVNHSQEVESLKRLLQEVSSILFLSNISIVNSIKMFFCLLIFMQHKAVILIIKIILFLFKILENRFCFYLFLICSFLCFRFSSKQSKINYYLF